MLQDPDDTHPNHFALENVEETTPPEGSAKGKWFSYTIGRGKSVIMGKMAGTMQSVTAHAHGVVEDLNARSNRQGSIYVSRRTGKNG